MMSFVEFVEGVIHIKCRRRQRRQHISFIHPSKRRNFWLSNFSIWRRKFVGWGHNCVFAPHDDRSANRVLKIKIVKANENTPPQRQRQRRQPTIRRQTANTFSRNKNESRSRVNMMNDPSRLRLIYINWDYCCARLSQLFVRSVSSLWFDSSSCNITIY